MRQARDDFLFEDVNHESQTDVSSNIEDLHAVEGSVQKHNNSPVPTQIHLLESATLGNQHTSKSSSATAEKTASSSLSHYKPLRQLVSRK